MWLADLPVFKFEVVNFRGPEVSGEWNLAFGPHVEIGLGGGRTITYLNASLPDSAILAVEIDKDVVDLAKKYFKFTESASMRAVVADGRSFLMRDNDKWDVILIDAYRGPFVPFHLLTKEFYTLVKSRLAPGGVVVQNIEPSTMLFDSAAATLNSVFPSVDLYEGGQYFLYKYKRYDDVRRVFAPEVGIAAFGVLHADRARAAVRHGHGQRAFLRQRVAGFGAGKLHARGERAIGVRRHRLSGRRASRAGRRAA